MNRRFLSLWDSIKHRFVLTREEKRVLCFVLVAFLLGVTVKQYREKAAGTESGMKTTPTFTATPALAPGKKQKRQRKKPPKASSPVEAEKNVESSQ